MTAEPQTLCFVVHGEDMTRLVRDRLLEDEPAGAWRLAMCLRADDDDDESAEVAAVAMQLLNGEKRLVGNSTDGITVEDEDPDVQKAHREAVRWLYAGRIKANGTWWRPVAKVTDVGINDLRNDHGKRVYAVDTGGMVNRGWHYVGPRETLLDTGDDEDEVIFEPCGELPHWMTPARDAAAAVKEWREVGRGLEERSHSKWYPSSPDPTLDDFDVDGRTEAAIAEAEAEERAERERREQEEDERYERERRAEFAMYERKILEQAGDDFVELSWPGSDAAEDAELREYDKAFGVHHESYAAGIARVPRVPFVRWCLDRYPYLRHMMPAWNNVCPSGLKLQMDSQDHSDWMLGGGLGHIIGDGGTDYTRHPSYGAAIAKMSEIVEEYGARRHEGTVILSPGHRAITSRIVYGTPNIPAPAGSVVVLPDLRPVYLATIKNAAAVLTQEGGAAAHLANVGREQSLAILRVPGVFRRFQPGDRVTVDAENGRVSHADDDEEGGRSW